MGAPAGRDGPAATLVDWRLGTQQDEVSVPLGSALVFHVQPGQDLTEVPEFVYDDCASAASETVLSLADFSPLRRAGELDIILPLDIAGSFFYVSSAGQGAACGAGQMRLRVNVVAAAVATPATSLAHSAHRQRRVEEGSGELASGSTPDETGSGDDTTVGSDSTTGSAGTTTGPPLPTSPDKGSFRTTFYLAGDYATVVRNRVRFQDGIKEELISKYLVPREAIKKVTVVSGRAAARRRAMIPGHNEA